MNQDVGKAAKGYFEQKFHCAESICRAMLERFSDDQTVRGGFTACTALGGGIGRTHKEVCGLVSGGLVAMGILHGRTTPDKKWDKLASVATEYRELFIKEFGSCNCGELLAKHGQQENFHKCKAMSREAAPILERLLVEYEKQVKI